MSEADIPSLHDLISFQDFEKAMNDWARNGNSGYRLVNPKTQNSQHLENGISVKK